MATTSKANFGRPIEAHYPYQAVLEYLLAASMLSNTGINAIMSLCNFNKAVLPAEAALEASKARREQRRLRPCLRTLQAA